MSQGRTPFFRKLVQTVQQAHWLNHNPQHNALFFEARDASRVSRRDFVRMLSAAGLLAVAGGLAPRFARGGENLNPDGRGGDPVAILGAGVSGLTAAYRLLQAGIAGESFEGSERTGGRILTKTNFNKDAMFCELGGELVDTNHADLIALASDLGVQIQERKEGDKGVDLYFFGGRHYADEQLISTFQPLATKLAADLKGIYDAGGSFTAKARRFDKLSLAQYLAETGKGVDKWVVDLLRVAYTIEYGRDAGEQSSLNLMALLKTDTSDGFKLFGDSDESKRIMGGSSSLPNALVKAIEGSVKIHRGHQLVRIAQAGRNMTLSFATEGSSKSLKFTRVICTLPFTMLRRVSGVTTLALGQRKQEAISQLGYGNNAKVMYGFTERWWRNPAIKLPAPSNGSIFTDLPLQCTWESSRGQAGENGILTNYLGGAGAKPFTTERFEKFREELNRIFPGVTGKFDGKRALMNWPEYKFSRGSYTCPLVGQYTTLLEVAGKSELNGRLIFAGEHTSGDFSGFMNGAVQSGNRAAKEILESKRSERPRVA